MRMKLTNEEQILKLEFRKKVIQEITAEENVSRKNRELRKYEIYKDRTRKWVIEALAKEFDPETVHQMQSRASNISILRKVVNKLARAYTGGVTRTAAIDGDQPFYDELGKALSINEAQKKADRYLELFFNCAVQVVPVHNYIESVGETKKFDLSLRVLAPHFYDVIEDADNPHIPRVFILTDFVERNQTVVSQSNLGEDGRANGIVPNFHSGNRRDEIIADSPDDAGSESREFIWWTDKYHFTTDADGEFITEKTPENLLNPIQKLPFVVYAEDQDGAFWAEGGSDRVDGAIHINVQLTDMACIANVQGWGQPVLTGKGLPKKVVGGPHRAIKLTHDTGDPEPKFYYASSNPPLDMWMRMIELHTALYLSTNNLSPTTVVGKLDAQNFPSGIAQLVEMSECTTDVQDKQAIFQDKEVETWKLCHLWLKNLSGKKALTEKFSAIPVPTGVDFSVKFNQVKPVISEKEHLENLKARKDLGLNTKAELILMDNPGLTLEEAEKKAAALEEEKEAPMEEGKDGVKPQGPPAYSLSQDGEEVEDPTPEEE